jgi:hypothetical protein
MRELIISQRCAVVPCPDNADGAPACRCKEGYEGSVAFNVDSQQWQGTCEKGVRSLGISDGFLLRRESVDALRTHRHTHDK